jgi:hypothetical protein
MPNQQHGLVFARAVQPHNKVLLAVIRPAQVQVWRRKSRIEEAFLHGFGRRRYAADGVGAVDLNQLLENIVRKLPGGSIDLGLGGERKQQESSEQKGGANFQAELLGGI